MLRYASLIMLVCACSQIEPEPRVISRAEYIEISHKMKPHIAKARKTLPLIKQRYQQRLPEGEQLVLTVELYDPDGSFELVPVKVQDWYADQILGSIAGRLFILQSYRQGDYLNFKEDAVADWMITKPDGSKEGDYVGRFLRHCQAHGE